jgi:CheY-like chemotaxis protein
LLVEDNLANLKLGKFMLSKRGFSVTTASDGVEAVDLITADGRAHREQGGVPAGGVRGAVGAPMRRVITLTTQRSSSNSSSASSTGTTPGAAGAAVSGQSNANASNDNCPDSSAALRHRTQSLTTITTTDISTAGGTATSTTSVLHDSLPPAPGVIGAVLPTPPFSASPASAPAADVNAAATPGLVHAYPSGAMSVGSTEPTALDASYSRFDVVLMDLSMPRLGGIQATQMLRSAGFAGRIIALTASDSEQQERACIEAGMDGLLRKPFKAETLVQAVLEQHRLTHADPPMRSLHAPAASSHHHSSAAAAVPATSSSAAAPATSAAGAFSSSSSSSAATSQSGSNASAAAPAPNRSRAILTSSGPLKHTLVVRAKTLVERNDGRMA